MEMESTLLLGMMRSPFDALDVFAVDLLLWARPHGAGHAVTLENGPQSRGNDLVRRIVQGGSAAPPPGHPSSEPSAPSLRKGHEPPHLLAPRCYAVRPAGGHHGHRAHREAPSPSSPRGLP